MIDGFGPVPVVRPESVADISLNVRQAAKEKTAVYPLGGRTMLDLGVPPKTPGRGIDMRGLAQVIDFPARDMTITVQAGITLAQLNAILATEKLQLPVDVPRSGEATLGGALATNTSGPRRYGYGTLRDFVIGISAINDEGQEFKAGGRVVKNVAGYDICKLLVGSLGTLGIISQVTLKLRPVPEERALVTLACADHLLETVLGQIHASRTRPVSVELLNREAADEIFKQAKLAVPLAPWVIIVGFEGNGEVVRWQVQQLLREITEVTPEEHSGSNAIGMRQALADWALWPKSSLTLKATILPSALARFCQDCARLSDKQWLRAHAGNGIVTGHFACDPIQDRPIPLCDAEGSVLGRFIPNVSKERVNLVSTWRSLAAQAGGTVTVTRCPSEWKKALAVWGPAPAGAWLMHAVKEKFDPQRLFNPGRFVNGI
jgi:glycolate oxidase FAD binding subunit